MTGKRRWEFPAVSVPGQKTIAKTPVKNAPRNFPGKRRLRNWGQKLRATMELRNTTLDDLASVIGFSATLRLTAWYGDTGNNLYIPATAEPHHILVRLLGVSSARRLSETWPNEWLAIPRLTGHEDDVRRHRIGRLLEKGFSTRDVAHMEHMSERRVQQICRELEQAGLIPVIGPAKRGRKMGSTNRTVRVIKRGGEDVPVFGEPVVDDVPDAGT